MLVGADGSKSKVREQRLPRYEREDLGIGVVCGKYTLNETTSQNIPKIMQDCSLNNLIPYGKGCLFVSSWRSGKESPNTSPRNSEPYTLWAYFIPQADVPSDFRELKAAALQQIVIDGIQGWAPPIEKVVREADLTTVSPIYLRCAPDLDHREPNDVTLPGDAIHSMTPAAGVGANTALRDAQNLTGLLTEANRNGTSLIDAIGTYEAKMRPYANAAVALSRQIAEGAASCSYVQRIAFRMILLLAQNIPFVMRATIGRGAVESYMRPESAS